jgi:hypothetical protein
MANNRTLPKDPEQLGKVLEAEHASKIAEMGKEGIFFGSRDNAIIYLAAIVVVLSAVGTIIFAILDPTLRADAFKALAALGLSALGYMFGAIGRRED